MYNNTVSKVSFARLNATKLYRVESAVVKVNMAKNHFSKSAKRKYVKITIDEYNHSFIAI